MLILKKNHKQQESALCQWRLRENEFTVYPGNIFNCLLRAYYFSSLIKIGDEKSIFSPATLIILKIKYFFFFLAVSFEAIENGFQSTKFAQNGVPETLWLHSIDY